MAEAGVPSEDGEVMEESPSNAIGTEFSAIQSRAGGYSSVRYRERESCFCPLWLVCHVHKVVGYIRRSGIERCVSGINFRA